MLAALISNLVRPKGLPPAKIAEFMPGDGVVEDPWESFKRLTDSG